MASEPMDNMNAQSGSLMPTEQQFRQRLRKRNLIGNAWRFFYYVSILLAILSLVTLFANIANEAFGTIAVQDKVPLAEVSGGRALDELSDAELVAILNENASGGLRVIIRDELSAISGADFTKAPLSDVLAGKVIPEGAAELTINDLDEAGWTEIITSNMSRDRIEDVVLTKVVGRSVVGSWSLQDTIFNFGDIEAEVGEKFPDAQIIRFYSWENGEFLSSPMSSAASETGIRTAILGTVYVIAIVIFISLPIGVGTALYLEEYATANFLNRLIETNIRNLAGVPSIIYGMLGLAIFVRLLGFFTSGNVFGFDSPTGRTVISAGMTLALLILPIIIINAQEALRAVPYALREASYGLGATRWQTIWNVTLPAAVPGILTGTILAISRAVGETAPLIVVGAATFILTDPTGPFSTFTVLPIQIYNWTSQPQDQFRDVAAAAIIVLLAMMLSLNAIAIILRNRFSIRY